MSVFIITIAEWIENIRGYLSSIQIANMDHIYWSVRPSIMREEDGVNGVEGPAASITLHEILVQHPSNNISIQSIT